MSDSHMHEAHASSAEADASFSAPSDAAAPDFLRFEPPAELIETAPLVSSSLGSSLGRTRRLRRDGWTATARRAFLERLVEARLVGLKPFSYWPVRGPITGWSSSTSPAPIPLQRPPSAPRHAQGA